jgi:hypothetical protein
MPKLQTLKSVEELLKQLEEQIDNAVKDQESRNG